MQSKLVHNILILKHLYLVLCLLGLYSTSVNALVEYNPTQLKAQQAKQYAQTLNQVATQVMGHYAALFSSQSSDKYPQNINTIQIIKAQLETDSGPPNQTTFTVTIQLGYLEDQITKFEQIKESFVFNLTKTSDIVDINRLYQHPLKSGNIAVEFNQLYYLNRQFAYAWLLLLDNLHPINPSEFPHSYATYHLTIGNNIFFGDVQKSLKKRRKWLGQGGHLLRSIDAKKTAKNVLQITLIIDWKGISSNHKWRIAKIKQTINIEPTEQGIYKIININEQHLLPDIAPWEKILC